MSALNDYKLLWNAALVRRGQSLARLLKVFAVLLSLGGVVAAIVQHDWLLSLRIGVGIPALVLLLISSFILVPGFVLMNTPANACLVPRMRKRMVEMTVATWAIAITTGLLMPTWQIAPVVALYVISMSMGNTGNRVGSLMVFVSALSYTILRMLPPQVEMFFMSVPGFACAMLAVVLYGAWVIRRIFPAGGDDHYGQRKHQTEAIERLQSMGRKTSHATPRRTVSLYRFALRRDIASLKPARLMLHALGPSSQWNLLVPFWSVLLLVGVGTHLLLQRVGVVDANGSLPLVAWVFLLTIVLAVEAGSFRYWKLLIEKSRKEQALLRLAGRSPSSCDWNRTFGGALVRQVLAGAGITAAIIIALGLLTGVQRDGLICLASLATSLVMPGVAGVLFDYSREQPSWTGQQSLLCFVISFVAIIAAVVLQFAIGPLAWVLLTAASNITGALVAARRWRLVLAAPVAFPAGRFA